MEEFSGRDLVNARYRYGREVDDALVIYVTARVTSLDTDLMWSGIAAPYWDFFGNEWKEYKKKGKSLREKALIRLLNAKGFPSNLSREQIMDAKDKASRELLNSDYYVPINERVIPDKIPPKIDYTDYRNEGEREEEE
jgi:hypothetical protein